MQHKPKRSLGQNFLTNLGVADKIVSEANLAGKETVLEIGPGKGVLTERILARAAKVVAIEKDDDLFSYLQEKFSLEIESGKLELLNGDILSFDPYALSPTPYALIANIPYNITGAIIQKFLSGKKQPVQMVLLVQREVAERVVARDKKESLLSISVKVYGTPHLVAKVSAGSFFPKPKVDSAILAIDNISQDFFRELTLPENFYSRSLASNSGLEARLLMGPDQVSGRSVESEFFAFLRSGFAHKRKLLSSNLKAYFPTIKEFAEASRAAGISAKSRAEELSPGAWKLLFSRQTVRKFMRAQTSDV